MTLFESLVAVKRAARVFIENTLYGDTKTKIKHLRDFVEACRKADIQNQLRQLAFTIDEDNDLCWHLLRQNDFKTDEENGLCRSLLERLQILEMFLERIPKSLRNVKQKKENTAIMDSLYFDLFMDWVFLLIRCTLMGIIGDMGKLSYYLAAEAEKKNSDETGDRP